MCVSSSNDRAPRVLQMASMIYNSTAIRSYFVSCGIRLCWTLSTNSTLIRNPYTLMNFSRAVEGNCNTVTPKNATFWSQVSSL